jgi:PhzF family phenazine biosynthesis protein
MKIPLFQIDAFTSKMFHGNPAAVCPLKTWPADEVLQSIAAENNLAETAFLVGGNGVFKLRWFTPTTEVDLCGHATLAAAYVVFRFMDTGRRRVRFKTRSGTLGVAQVEDRLVLDFPAVPARRVKAVPGLARALGARPVQVWAAPRDYMVVLRSEKDVRGLSPNMEALKKLNRLGVIATAPGETADFVSRFFAPRLGVPEDPVTGSAHCTLVPYWHARLRKEKLQAQQVSPRGGELLCTPRGERVTIAGRCVLYLRGGIEV